MTENSRVRQQSIKKVALKLPSKNELSKFIKVYQPRNKEINVPQLIKK
jgi:hypothetical protein